jgi:hypothetical protein
LRNKTCHVFPEDPFESPILSGLEEIPFISLASTAQIQDALKGDIGGNNTFRFASSRGSPIYNERGAIIRMQSPASKTLPWQVDGVLGQSNFQMTAAPAHEVFDLTYYEDYVFFTLLTGNKVRIAYSPFYNNPTILQKQYKKLQSSASGPIFLNILDKLHHGIAIIQKLGQTLMFPTC